MAVLAKLAYGEGLDPVTLLALRFSIACAGMWATWGWRYRQGGRAQLAPGRIWPLVGLGAVGYVGQSFSYFTAVEWIPAAATGLLLYTYPILVTLLAWVFYREALTGRKVVALGMASAGGVLVLDILALGGGGEGGSRGGG